MNHSKVYREIEKLNLRPDTARKVALEEIEKMEANVDYAKKVKFNPLEWRIQLAFAWERTPPSLQKLWPQLVAAQINRLYKPIKI